MKTLIYVLLLVLLASACSSQKTIRRYTIASNLGDCIGVAPQKCMLIKIKDSNDWQFFYGQIEGFEYEEGFEYILKVEEQKLDKVPADASSIKYTLVKLVSKTPKTSTNLPINKTERYNYQLTGKVLSVYNENIGRGAATGKFEVKIAKVQVTSSTNKEFKEGDRIYCELISRPKVNPVVGREYVFKAKNLHPAYAKGVYLLDTDIMDLVY